MIGLSLDVESRIHVGLFIVTSLLLLRPLAIDCNRIIVNCGAVVATAMINRPRRPRSP